MEMHVQGLSIREEPSWEAFDYISEDPESRQNYFRPNSFVEIRRDMMGRTSRNSRLVHLLSPSIEELTICSPLPKMANKYMFEDLPMLKDHCPPK